MSRSAPQKQPMPKIACAIPSGMGARSGRPETKCVSAVGIGWLRPGRASAGVTMRILEGVKNMAGLLQARGMRAAWW